MVGEYGPRPLTAWIAVLAVLIINISFSHTNTPIFFKIQRVQAIDDMNKLYKFHENQTTIADFIA